MNVLVTEATRNASNAIVRALYHADYTVLGSDYRRLPGNAHSRYSSGHCTSAALDDPSYCDSLLDILANNKVDVLVPGNQVGPFAQHRERLSQAVQMLVPSEVAWAAAYYNDQTLASCRQLGIPCPLEFDAEQGLAYLRQDPRHKIMIKPRADLGGGQGLELVHSEARLATLLETLDPSASFMQEYIPGPVQNMRSVAVLYDQRSQLRMFFSSHKLRQWPQQGGICALGRSTYEPELASFAQAFFEHWQWQGVAEVEIKIDARNGLPRLIEINPRFWGHTHYAVQAGANFPLAYCRLAAGEHVEQADYRLDFNYVHWASYLRCIAADSLHGPGVAAACKALGQAIVQPRASNADWRDWRFTAAKRLHELQDRLRQ